PRRLDTAQPRLERQFQPGLDQRQPRLQVWRPIRVGGAQPDQYLPDIWVWVGDYKLSRGNQHHQVSRKRRHKCRRAITCRGATGPAYQWFRRIARCRRSQFELGQLVTVRVRPMEDPTHVARLPWAEVGLPFPANGAQWPAVERPGFVRPALAHWRHATTGDVQYSGERQWLYP